MTRATSRAKRALLLLGVALIAVAVYVANFGLWPRFFDIEWDEEVLLHDGRVIVVHVKHIYQRKGLRLEQFPEDTYSRGMEFSFEINPQKKLFTHYFKRGVLNFLDQKDGKWYIGYYADSGDESSEIGSLEIYPHIAILNQDLSITKPKSFNEVPVEIKEVNIMPATPSAKVLSKFNGKTLTLPTKMQHWKEYPTGAGEHTIHRITPQPITHGATK
jgi:hypothetical protein